ncbi:hypothetical protein AUEXF2481DRAFT_355214 [Aureobasidium subglaciale EXF-2481]|uniref:Uncharacterized protein n=1 Tax=Aureobasidium subglaciale (strain EXF-2481) TaxID=1043005 RepID=A0A074YGF2_AURSE|nr:uncharacterized protein AUEXF2481DRAFT_355214 [Aureobasidium subglaciale EXF-2481]KEQ93147.1 hypothetical protein AUEXF2481DRAFT_355214 [Aureobasidium subglaciale EXF-2481]
MHGGKISLSKQAIHLPLGDNMTRTACCQPSSSFRITVTSTILITARELRWLTTPHPCPKLHHTRPLSMIRAWQQRAEARQVNIPYRHNQHKESRKTASRCHHFGSRMVLALRQLAVIVTVFRTLGDWANMLVCILRYIKSLLSPQKPITPCSTTDLSETLGFILITLLTVYTPLFDQ